MEDGDSEVCELSTDIFSEESIFSVICFWA